MFLLIWHNEWDITYAIYGVFSQNVYPEPTHTGEKQLKKYKPLQANWPAFLSVDFSYLF